MFLLGFSFLGVWEVNKRSGGSKQRDPYPAKEEEFGPLKMSKIEKRGRTEEGGGDHKWESIIVFSHPPCSCRARKTHKSLQEEVCTKKSLITPLTQTSNPFFFRGGWEAKLHKHSNASNDWEKLFLAKCKWVKRQNFYFSDLRKLSFPKMRSFYLWVSLLRSHWIK